jgi:Peptidase S24-like
MTTSARSADQKKRAKTMGSYQAKVIGYTHPKRYDWGIMVPCVSAPNRREARRILRRHFAHSLTPFIIRRLWMLTWKKKFRAGGRITKEKRAMGFYEPHIEKLKRGETTSFRPSGNSMTPRIHSKDLVTVAPVAPHEVKVGDAVLCKVKGRIYVHLVKAIGQKEHGGYSSLQFQIGNNKGGVNGWTGDQNVYGKVIKVEK